MVSTLFAFRGFRLAGKFIKDSIQSFLRTRVHVWCGILSSVLLSGCVTAYSLSEHPLISGAKVIGVACNLPPGEAWMENDSATKIEVPGIDLLKAHLEEMPPHIRSFGIADVNINRNPLTGVLRMAPRTDCDLVLWISGRREALTSSGYLVSGVYVPPITSGGALSLNPKAIVGPLAGCVFDVALLDSQSGEQISFQSIILNEKQADGEQLEDTLRRLTRKAAKDTVIALGLKAGEASSVYVRAERQPSQASIGSATGVASP